MNIEVICEPTLRWSLLKYLLLSLLLILAAATMTQLVRTWRTSSKKFLIIFVGLSLAPSAGLFLLDILFNRNLQEARYLLFAIPFLPVLLTYGLIKGDLGRRSWLMLPLLVLLCLQMTGINWGAERTYGQTGSDMRSLAKLIKESSLPTSLAVIGKDETWDRGTTGSLIYELDPNGVVITASEASNLDELQRTVGNYDDLWLVFFFHRDPANYQKELLTRLEQSGNYTEAFRTLKGRRLLVHLRKVKNENSNKEHTLNLR